MTLNISQLCERVADRYPDLKQIDKTIIRFTRTDHGLPFAVYYLDIAENLPRSQEMLTKYQDRVIGASYFEGNKSLQWNNYLYFVTSADRLAKGEVLQAKELIERDRNYARKFVIAEEEIDSVLEPPVIAAAETTPHESVLSIWTEQLVKAGLDKAILSDDPLPKRLKLIETSSTEIHRETEYPRRKAGIKVVPFIRSFKLSKFRDFPLQKYFEFGKVNLIYGANGTGKTSLFEAIELFYCGRNKRNPDARPRYELAAVFDDGQSEIATVSRELQVYRDRNLEWYGQYEIKTNNLYQSFAQFNYLDTDAAVSIADSTNRIEDDLSKLLVGPDASKIWRDIERVNEEISLRLRGLRPLKTQIVEELSTLEKRLKEINSIQKESNSIRVLLDELIHRIGWSGSEGKKEVSEDRRVEILSELLTLAEQATTFDWADSPISLDGLAKYCTEVTRISEIVETDIKRLEILLNKQNFLAKEDRRTRKALDLAKQAERFIDAGVPNRIVEFNEQKRIVTKYSEILADLDPNFIGVLSTIDAFTPVTVFHEAAISKRSSAEKLLKKAKYEYTNFSNKREQALNLAQELRQVAEKILHDSPRPDECPLCHSQYGLGELAKRINIGTEDHLEALGKTLINQIKEQEIAVRDASAVEGASYWLKKFCERTNVPTDTTINSALADVENIRRSIADAQGRLNSLEVYVLALELKGITLVRFEEIITRLHELDYPLEGYSRNSIDRLLSSIEHNAESISRGIEVVTEEVVRLQDTLEKNLGSTESSVQDLKAMLSQLKERLAATESLRAKLGKISSLYPWPGGRPFAELVVEVSTIRRVAVDLQTTLAKERQAQTISTESTKRKEHLHNQLSVLQARMKRLTEAQSTLKKLLLEHSLKSAMKSALQQNRAGIESIFMRIHSPAEFRAIGSSWTKLIRKLDSREVKLSEISTGQRAAFALSIFLAQNAQLSVAPPIVLVDDPIAHFDDLNSLSFLDYLREIVLKGRRQIFFATAEDKLATLFQRKFDFLGSEGFRRFDLSRHF